MVPERGTAGSSVTRGAASARRRLVTMPVSDISSTAQDYLKVIWAATEWDGPPITVTQLAERMGVRAATVSDGIRRLAGQGLLKHEPYGSIELTDDGRAVAVAMVRRHRLIETFLVEVLGYEWDEVHDEAEVLEHAVSETLVARIDAVLGHPARDPHGDPIPSADGTPKAPAAHRLDELEPGARGVVSRISDADADVLRHLAEAGVGLDSELTVVERDAGRATVRLDGRTIALESRLSGAVWVTADAAADPSTEETE
jgi:DtxR family transcriptional regulator, Mn-dependent transcriptional regulator